MQEIDQLYYTIMYNLLNKYLRWTQGGTLHSTSGLSQFGHVTSKIKQYEHLCLILFLLSIYSKCFSFKAHT